MPESTKRRDRLTDEDILRAAEYWEFASSPDDEMPANEFRLGFDGRGRLLELQVLIFDSGDELVIHAMKARKQYVGLLGEPTAEWGFCGDLWGFSLNRVTNTAPGQGICLSLGAGCPD